MEPILSKLQEGVKYPRFERDATKTINDLVEHITKERGVYSSSIEPNPNEHSIWFNTNNNTLYIYDGNTWATVSDNNVSILKEGKEFLPYPVINILNSTSYIDEWYIEENKHYVIIISANNIRKYLNYIVDYNEDNERQFIIIGDDINTSGTFLVNIYDTYIYYIKLSSTNIEEDNVFYCTNGFLYYNGNGTSNEGNGIDISGFYTENRLKNEIENFEGDTIENINLNGIFIEPKDEATIVIGKQDFISDIAILGEKLNNIYIYMYNNKLKIGGANDNISLIDNIIWYNANIYCNCKEIGTITATHDGSSLNLNIDTMTFVISNNNYLIITPSICSHINELYVNVIKETDDDHASVYIQEKTAGAIKEYINLCGTSLETDTTKLQIETFITTTIADIDVEDIRTCAFDIEKCKMLIIDAPYKELNHTNSIYYLQSVDNLYTTNNELINYLNTIGNLQVNLAINETINYNDRIDIQYRDYYTNKIIFSKSIYKR